MTTEQTSGTLTDKLEELSFGVRLLTSILHRSHIDALLSQPRHKEDPRRLPQYGFKAYSQNEEDGIIQEIFRRIGTTNRRFIEVGCADGIENNTTYLLLAGWQGHWVDANPDNIDAVKIQFGTYLEAGALVAEAQVVTRENINSLLASDPRDVDLFSLDIDGNDYWVWEALTAILPRVAIIEYNGTFRPPVAVVAPYRPAFVWDRTGYFGASLKALEILGSQKGYRMVGCNLTAANAFFVRADLVQDLFCSPFTAENHYESPAYGLYTNILDVHTPGVGPYISVSDVDHTCGVSEGGTK